MQLQAQGVVLRTTGSNVAVVGSRAARVAIAWFLQKLERNSKKLQKITKNSKFQVLVPSEVDHENIENNFREEMKKISKRLVLKKSQT